MPPENSSKPSSSRKTVVTIAVIAVVLIAAGVFAESSHTGNSVATIATTTPVTNPETTGSQTVGMTASSSESSTSTPVSTPASTYKDGSYTATGSYNTPAGTEHVGVTLTLANDIVTSATVVSEAQAPESKRYQGQFISGYKSYVIGKDISTLNLTKVSGSSLTPQGFDDAVAQIKTQAQA